MSLVLIHPAPDEGWADMRLAGVLSHALAGRQVRVIRRAEELNDLTGQRLLFAAALGEYGVNLELTRMLSALRRTPDLLSGATAGIIIDGLSPLYTKSTAGELALAANLAGCALVGRPLVEGAGQLHNFRIQAKNAGTDLLGAYRASAADLAQRVETAGFPARVRARAAWNSCRLASRPKSPGLRMPAATGRHSGEIRMDPITAFSASSGLSVVKDHNLLPVDDLRVEGPLLAGPVRSGGGGGLVLVLPPPAVEPSGGHGDIPPSVLLPVRRGQGPFQPQAHLPQQGVVRLELVPRDSGPLLRLPVWIGCPKGRKALRLPGGHRGLVLCFFPSGTSPRGGTIGGNIF